MCVYIHTYACIHTIHIHVHICVYVCVYCPFHHLRQFPPQEFLFRLFPHEFHLPTMPTKFGEPLQKKKNRLVVEHYLQMPKRTEIHNWSPVSLPSWAIFESVSKGQNQQIVPEGWAANETAPEHMTNVYRVTDNFFADHKRGKNKCSGIGLQKTSSHGKNMSAHYQRMECPFFLPVGKRESATIPFYNASLEECEATVLQGWKTPASAPIPLGANTNPNPATCWFVKSNQTTQMGTSCIIAKAMHIGFQQPCTFPWKPGKGTTTGQTTFCYVKDSVQTKGQEEWLGP